VQYIYELYAICSNHLKNQLFNTDIMNKRKLLFLFLLVTATVSYGQNAKREIKNLHLPWIHFIWENDSLGGRHFDKVGMSIPIKIENLPYDFTAQLDLGAVHTVFYGKPLAPYLKMFPELTNKLDIALIQGYVGYDACRIFQHMNLYLDKVPFKDIPVGHYADFGDSISMDSAKTVTPKHIGTIAPDLFQGKVLIIDYPNQRLCMLDEMPAILQKEADFVTFKIRKGRIKVPFLIGSIEKDLLFDTGSSLFSIFTSKDNSVFFTEPTTPIVDSIIGNQWKQVFKVYGQQITKDIKVGKNKMKPAMVYSLDDKGQKQFEDEENIIGTTGNVYFLNRLVIIDYKNKKFGIL
jgi:hypothetical protein